LTENRTYATASRVGRKKQFETRITLPLAEGETERIAAVLKPGEVRLDFIRQAIEREITRRSRQSKPPTAE
jgi:hypothetical protein